jgi:hypothetical protein
VIGSVSGHSLPSLICKKILLFPNAKTLDLLVFRVYTLPLGAAGTTSFDDPLEGTETNMFPGAKYTIWIFVRE